eukprot:TRINITY_DN22299_c0_g1_i1.p1 TRINITY_DN22299_c0_g1~~TRINITY_DN22299_c0_g1_i1.p1  ORF type:complete len:568 (-),score=88.85 TRINITY_DN22299_c0_g1_i1:48-1751(-)
MPGILSTASEAILWPFGVRRKKRELRRQDEGDGHCPVPTPAAPDDESWEVDHVHFLGVLSGAALAWWAMNRMRNASSASVVAEPTGSSASSGLVVAALPRIPLSDFFVLLRSGAITAVTYLASSPPAGSLILRTKASLATASPGNMLLGGLGASPSLVPGNCAVPTGSAAVSSSASVATPLVETLLLPGSHQGIFDALRAHEGISFECAELPREPDADFGKLSLLFDAVGLLASLAAVWYLVRGSGQGDAFAGKRLEEAAPSDLDRRAGVTMADVAGMERVKEELGEVIAFLRNPESFYALGARTPRGILLTGPSGTGKTLLARAVAGEAGVPFLYASSASFVEIFVGQGAKSIRQFFEQARSCAPCIVFFDEIDAVGVSRQASASGGNQEHAQTLNQLLMELDGVESHLGGEKAPVVVTMAATNRYDCLDEALVRPGRFDRVVLVGLPNHLERRACLEIHAKKLVTEGLDLEDLAARTDGCSGAELGNLLNEAGLMAARRRASAVRMEHIEEVLAQPRLQQQQRPRQSQQGDFTSRMTPSEVLGAPEVWARMLAAAMADVGGVPET